MNNEYRLTNDYLRSWKRLVQSKIVIQYSTFDILNNNIRLEKKLRRLIVNLDLMTYEQVRFRRTAN